MKCNSVKTNEVFIITETNIDQFLSKPGSARKALERFNAHKSNPRTTISLGEKNGEKSKNI